MPILKIMKKYAAPHRFAVFLLLIAVSATQFVFADSDGNRFADPERFADWQVVGPNGGDVRAIAVDPKDKAHLLLTTADGQIHSSNDAGRTWRMLANLNQPLLVLDQLIFDIRDSKTIYVSGHRGKRPGGFFRSMDGGVTWKESKDLHNEAINAMTQAKDDPNTLFVGSSTGVWMSKNSGEDWSLISSTTMPVNINSLEVDPKTSSTIYAGTNWRPYKSTDSGKNWRLIKTGMIDDSDVFAITVNSKDNDHLIASACSGIYESLNGGDQWKKIQGIPSTSRRTRAIIQHPSLPGTVFAGTTQGFWLSNTGGKTWMLTTQRNLEINSIAVHPDDPNRVYIATNNYGVMISTDGGKNFAQSNDSFTSRFTYSVTADATQPNRLYATTQNTASSGGFVFYSADAGHNWIQSKGIDINKVSPFTILQDRVTPDKLYMGTNLGIFTSVDRGVSWTLITPPKVAAKKPVRKGTAAAKAPAKKVTAAPVKPKVAAKPAADTTAAGPQIVPALTEKVKVLAYTEDGRNGLLAGTDNGLYRTYDITKGWEKIPFGENLNANIFVIHASPLVPGTIWVGTASSGVIVTRDDGKTWERVNVVPDNTPVSSIMTDPKRPNNMYVGSIQTFYVSRDGGRTWNRRGGGLPLGDFTSILINPNNPDEIFISSAIETDGGIFYSEDAGNKWKRMDSKDMKIPSRRVWSMAFDPQDPKRIFAGSHSSGVYMIERRQDTAKTDSAATTEARPN
jgi:photosystem II stability/assembly factor-like uncharacterized protein